MNRAIRLRSLFHQYVNGACSEAEHVEFMTLIAESEHDGQLKSLMDELWNEIPAHNDLAEHTKANIMRSILAHDVPLKVIKKNPIYSQVGRMAAVITLVLLSSAGIYYFFKVQPKNLISENTIAPVVEHQFIRLPDESTVLLNEGSKLEFPESFDGELAREVILTGEGYFNIKPDADQPFIVHTGNVKTTVLGTAFNIKAYPDDSSITVTVTRGKVSVGDDKKIFRVIMPNQQITIHKADGEVKHQPVDSKEAIAWADRDIFFDDITLGEAVKQLEDRFKSKINFLNPRLKDCRFTATFVKGETLDQILTVICEFNGADFSYDEKGNILINGEGC